MHKFDKILKTPPNPSFVGKKKWAYSCEKLLHWHLLPRTYIFSQMARGWDSAESTSFVDIL